MILLIPSFQELNLINLTDLNSIMILLIPLRKLQDSLIPIFKFHYDSINSNKNLSNRSVLTDLNSIMILLIRLEELENRDGEKI